MKRWLTTGVTSITFTLTAILTPIASMAQTAPITDAYKQLRLLDSQTEAGMNYPSFTNEWGKTLGLVNIALEDSAASPLTRQLEKIKISYSDVATAWKCKIEYGKFAKVFYMCLGNELPERYPEIAGAIKDGSAMEYTGDVAGKVTISYLFSAASIQVKTLGAMLNKKK